MLITIVNLIISVVTGLIIGLILKGLWGTTIINIIGFIFIWVLLVLTLSCLLEKGGVR